METTDREGRVAKLWVSGFTPEQVEIVKTTLEGVAAVSQLSDFMPPSMIAQNGKAVVELEKRYMANSDLLLINVGDGTAETASQVIMGWAFNKPVIGVGDGIHRCAWVTEHTLACFESFPDGVTYLKTYLGENK